MAKDEPKVKVTVRIFNSTKHFLESIALKLGAKRRGGAPAYGEAIEAVSDFAEQQMALEHPTDSANWSAYVETLENNEVRDSARRKRNARLARKRRKAAERSLKRG